ncbi:transcription initiation factor IIA subunit 1-like [Ornithodoros turicata]|uniref:Putative transcription initiation factor iia subunit 1 n=1 Tax=Ornithodoros turicata TaxID=34597 RepID=A0A2R5LFK0_9ACAR
MAASSVPKLYRSVIEDVINGVKDIFLDEGVDDQALQELRQIWEKKLTESKAVDTHEPAPQPTFQRTAHAVVQQPQVHQAAATANPVAAQAITHQLTIGPNGIVQPTVLQYHATPTSGGQKLTITLPAQSAQQGLQTVMYRPQQIHSSSAATAALALHPDVAASLLQGGVLNMAHATALQAAARNVNAQAAAGNIQFQHIMKPTGEPGQYTVTMGQALAGHATPMVVTSGQPVAQAAVPVTAATQQRNVAGNPVIQLDGANDTSDEEEEEDDFQDDDDKDDNDDDVADEDNDDAGEEEEPLNSDDDVSDEEVSENFEIDNVVVCQYDKISRSRNRWKFHLKDGIMNLQGKDYVFQKAVGDAEW